MDDVRGHLHIQIWPLPWDWGRPKFRKYRDGDWQLWLGCWSIEWFKD